MQNHKQKCILIPKCLDETRMDEGLYCHNCNVCIMLTDDSDELEALDFQESQCAFCVKDENSDNCCRWWCTACIGNGLQQRIFRVEFNAPEWIYVGWPNDAMADNTDNLFERVVTTDTLKALDFPKDKSQIYKCAFAVITEQVEDILGCFDDVMVRVLMSGGPTERTCMDATFLRHVWAQTRSPTTAIECRVYKSKRDFGLTIRACDYDSEKEFVDACMSYVGAHETLFIACDTPPLGSGIPTPDMRCLYYDPGNTLEWYDCWTPIMNMKTDPDFRPFSEIVYVLLKR